eukprot:Gregarina_sp_Poly_1__8221@NODE_478_length_8064_cov_159_533200_g387_i0_p3_GENE_NODE_478_length_8064_cov_159_533200_g387_i0NODE_478_length_8064_cov_159_533200_g387_i0_p3_ORF_typecomplete_len363_score64_03Cyclin_N/PF00134_23/2_2e03Cyclin_N/PF00134_23/8_6e12DUF4122/PF13498_6/0_23_NODE_478_length_8064_cov_159_533200_g387_i020743162
MPFPLESTHLKHWIWNSKQELQDELEANFNKSTTAFIQECKERLEAQNIPFEADTTIPFTVEEQQLIVRWFVRTGLQYSKGKLLSYRTIDTTMAFFTRFYLKESVVRYQPSVLFFTCLIAAIKAENIGDPLTLEFLFKGAESQLSVVEVLKLEAVVLDVLRFHLLILHVGTPLTYLTNEYYLQNRRQQTMVPPASWKPTTSVHSNGTPKTTEELFGDFVGHLQEQCEQLSLRTYGSLLNFLYTPNELAIGIFLHVGSVDYNIPGLGDFVLRIQPSAIQTSSTQSAKFKDRILMLKNEIFEFVDRDKEFGPEGVFGKFKEVKKWRATLERGGKKKRDAPPVSTGGTTTPQPKKAKIDDTVTMQ